MSAEFVPDMDGQFDALTPESFDDFQRAQLQRRLRSSRNVLQFSGIPGPEAERSSRSSLVLAAGNVAVQSVDDTIFTVLNDGQVRPHTYAPVYMLPEMQDREQLPAAA